MRTRTITTVGALALAGALANWPVANAEPTTGCYPTENEIVCDQFNTPTPVAGNACIDTPQGRRCFDPAQAPTQAPDGTWRIPVTASAPAPHGQQPAPAPIGPQRAGQRVTTSITSGVDRPDN